jgi:hypothetical protein
MAKFKPILGELSGKLAGVVFSHNTAGMYVRQKSTPVNGSSTRQQLVRSRLAYLSSSYQALSDTQRALWANYGAMNPSVDGFGAAVALTGQQAFCQLSARLLNTGGVFAASPPATTNTYPPVSLTVAIASPATITLSGAATLGATFKYEVLLTPGRSAANNPNLKAARWAAVSAAAVGGTVALVSAVPFTSGLWSNVFVRVQDSSGQINTPTKFRVQAA